MKKFFAIVTAVLMCACLCTQVAAVELAAAQSKISSELQEQFSQIGSSEKVTAYVAMQDVDHDAVMKEFARRYPEEYAAYVAAKTGSAAPLGTASANEELLQRALELKRAVYRDFYLAQNQAVISDYVQTRSQLFVSAYSPVAILELDRGTALGLARSADVISLSATSTIASNVRAIEDPLFPDDLTSGEVVLNLDTANLISRANYLRDTKNLTGSGVKIGILESAGVPDTTNPYLENAAITIRTGDEAVSHHATTDALILAAVDSSGVAHGIVPDAQFYCTRWYNKNVSNAIKAQYLYDDVEWMISCGVNIINASCSLQIEFGDEGTYDTISQWIDHIAAVHDVHFVTSAGNNDTEPFTAIHVTPPGMAYNAITVGGFWANGSENIVGFTLSSRFLHDEKDDDVRPEKPNLVANAYFGDYKDDDGTKEPYDGTSFAAPQVAGVIAQLCCWDGNLKFRQNVVGAVLAASAAEKVDSQWKGFQGDVFKDEDAINDNLQISDKEGAGILDARWAWGILANNNYWNIIRNGSPIDTESGDLVFYTRTVTIDASVHTLTRIAIFWTKNNTNINHSNNSVGENLDLTNFNLYVYDSAGELVACSKTAYSNFEIVQFKPEAPGVYTIKIEIVVASNRTEYVGLAIW